jgi:hypothetical protein
MSLAVPSALADKGAPAPTKDTTAKKSMASCTAFDQADKDDDTTTFTIRNSCSIPIDCSISWKLVCAPDSKKRRSEHPTTQSIKMLADGAQQSTDVSAATCGADAWALQGIEWSCSPNKD